VPALAQTPAAAPDRTLDAVVVTASRTPTRADVSLAEVTVIDRRQIEQALGRSLAELLAQHAGVQFWSSGGLGMTSSVALRGLESRHTLLLVDGVRYGSATIGTPAWETIALDSIERIEIVRGPLTGLYGSDAVGGVVQVFTRRGVPGFRVDASATAGSHGHGQASLGLGFGAGAFDGAVQIGKLRTRGFSSTNERVPFGSFNPDDDGFRQTSGSARLGWRFAEGWRVEAHLLSAEGQVQFDDGPGADSRAALRTGVQGLALQGQPSPGWRTTLRLARSTDRNDTRVTSSGFFLGEIGTVQRQLAWEHTLDTAAGTLLLAADRVEQSVSRPDTPFSVSDRRIDGLAAGLNGRSGAHGWQLSLRRDRNSQFGSQTTGSLAYGFDLAPTWRVAGSIGTSFVAPSFNQLYYPDFGNPALLPEEGRHRELSLRWADAGRQLRLSWFDHRITGFITPGPHPSNTDADVEGLSLSAEAALLGWTLGASLDHLDPRNATAGSPNQGKLLPRRAKDSLKLSALTPTWSGWRAGASWQVASERFDDAANSLRIGGHGVLDLNAEWRIDPAWSLGLKLNNALDKRYETVYGYNQSGREFFVTLRYGAQ